jgi:predicted MPP superfamily phosphohydrolase
VSHDKVIGDGPVLLGCLAGVVSEILIGQRLRVPRNLNYAIAVGLFTIYLLTDGEKLAFINDIFSYTFMGIVHSSIFLWFFCAVPTAILLLLRDRVPPFRSDRREILRRSTAALCAAPAAVLAFGVITRKEFQVKEVDVKLPHLPQDLNGLKILQLSDIHLGTFFGAKDLARVIDESNGLGHDLAFITGDLITTKWDPLERCLAELKRLRSPNGVWGCMGNHELYAKVQNYTEFRARQLGMFFLRRASAELKFGTSRVNLVGVDYQRRHAPYLVGVEKFVQPGAFNLLLSHNPDVFPVAANQGFDLTLAGHTHGGQINVEILGENLNPADFITPYTKGLYTKPNSAIYVTSGLGTIGMPVRLGAPPEITLLRLCRS